MDDQSLAELERRLGQRSGVEAPDALRALTLSQVERELRAARWDRRLGRVAASLVLTGIGLNAGVGLSSEHSTSSSTAFATNDALVRTAVAVALATDVETGRLMAHQLAVIQDQSISPQQLAAIDAAIDVALRQGNEG